MSTVVDSSVLVAAILDSGPRGAWAERVLTRGSLYAPQPARVEATNVFRRLERHELITTPEANAAQDDLMQLDIELFSFEPFADRVWELRHNMTSYDAWCVALAEALKLPLAPLDEPLSKSKKVTCQFLTPGRRERKAIKVRDCAGANIDISQHDEKTGCE
ncbi:MAG TPA: type II toxin-antitoxin system VapC family toxin [Steroidobacteraceae bacterium]|nr:type II toxin-antitoxin system VapC family toxin [Steroidobacteraceae bacterium]